MNRSIRNQSRSLKRYADKVIKSYGFPAIHYYRGVKARQYSGTYVPTVLIYSFCSVQIANTKDEVDRIFLYMHSLG